MSMTTLVYPDSLGDTLDAVNEALFDHQALPVGQWAEAAAWIAGRQGLPGSYAGMFAPTAYDHAFGALAFTGEPVSSHAAVGHVLSEECCHVLYRLGFGAPEQVAGELRSALDCIGSDTAGVCTSLDHAHRAIFGRILQSEGPGGWSGVYCCGSCTASLWRHLLASRTSTDQRRLEEGLDALRRSREENGRWRRFPYYYTLLALAEIDLPAARAEIQYTAPLVERSLRRMSRTAGNDETKHDRRRRVLLQRILEMC